MCRYLSRTSKTAVSACLACRRVPPCGPSYPPRVMQASHLRSADAPHSLRVMGEVLTRQLHHGARGVSAEVCRRSRQNGRGSQRLARAARSVAQNGRRPRTIQLLRSLGVAPVSQPLTKAQTNLPTCGPYRSYSEKQRSLWDLTDLLSRKVDGSLLEARPRRVSAELRQELSYSRSSPSAKFPSSVARRS